MRGFEGDEFWIEGKTEKDSKTKVMKAQEFI